MPQEPNRQKHNKNLGLYIHIPFCRQKCAYCDFLSFACKSEILLTEYAQALMLEIRSRKESAEGRRVDTLYIGGGTPSLMPADDFVRIMDETRRAFDIAEDAEITVEANPASLTREKLEYYRNCGVNRLSIGVQSFDNRILRILGRLHDKNEAFQMIQTARKAGFDNISIDLMFGVPTQSIKMWTDTLRQGIFLGPQHISLYSLQLEEGTDLYRRVFKEQSLSMISDQVDRQMYHEATAMLRDAGYDMYEISNACLPGRQSRHNRKYWSYEEYLGIGLGASSFFDGKRFKNYDKMYKYIQAIKEKRIPIDEKSIEHYGQRDEMGIYVFTGLRRMEGIDLKDFKARFGVDLFSVYDQALLGRHKGRLVLYDDRLYITEDGMDVSNAIMAEFV